MQDILNKYNTMFSVSVIDLDEMASITDSEKYFRFVLNKLDLFENSCKKNAINYENYIKSLQGTLSSLNRLTSKYKNYGKEFYNVSDKFEYSNPFHVLSEWVQAEVLDFQAMLEIISQRYEYGKIKAKAREKLENEQNQFYVIQSGKKNISLILNNKSVAEIGNSVQDLVKQFEVIENLEKIIVHQLVRHYLPEFKKNKLVKFSDTLNKFLLLSMNEVAFLVSQSKAMSQNFTDPNKN